MDDNYSTKQFLSDHKTELIIAGASLVVVMGILVCAKYKIDARDCHINLLEKRVNELEHLCQRKDAVFIETISDSLRHGSSLGGKHMADRKLFLYQNVA